MTLTEHAKTGYYGNSNPHLYSSPSWYAHALGEYLHSTGRSIPSDVRMGRGYSIRSGDMLFKIAEDKKIALRLKLYDKFRKHFYAQGDVTEKEASKKAFELVKNASHADIVKSLAEMA